MTEETAQFELNFDAGLTTRFKKFSDCLIASVYSSNVQFKNIAADLDMSPPDFSQKLNPDYLKKNFSIHLLPELLEATGDLTPVYWLVEKFCQDADAQQRQAVNEFLAALPKFLAIAEQLKEHHEPESKLKAAE